MIPIKIDLVTANFMLMLKYYNLLSMFQRSVCVRTDLSVHLQLYWFTQLKILNSCNQIKYKHAEKEIIECEMRIYDMKIVSNFMD